MPDSCTKTMPRATESGKRPYRSCAKYCQERAVKFLGVKFMGGPNHRSRRTWGLTKPERLILRESAGTGRFSSRRSTGR
jgi:hypothetical protein